jgi:cytochrome c5
MKSIRFVIAALVLTSTSALALAVTLNDTKEAAPSKSPAAQRQEAQPQDDGERVFQQHCSRCHNAPDGFSPRISGAILRHMRVRASLSRRQEEDLLRFFNPK